MAQVFLHLHNTVKIKFPSYLYSITSHYTSLIQTRYNANIPLLTTRTRGFTDYFVPNDVYEWGKHVINIRRLPSSIYFKYQFLRPIPISLFENQNSDGLD